MASDFFAVAARIFDWCACKQSDAMEKGCLSSFGDEISGEFRPRVVSFLPLRKSKRIRATVMNWILENLAETFIVRPFTKGREARPIIPSAANKFFLLISHEPAAVSNDAVLARNLEGRRTSNKERTYELPVSLFYRATKTAWLSMSPEWASRLRTVCGSSTNRSERYIALRARLRCNDTPLRNKRS